VALRCQPIDQMAYKLIVDVIPPGGGRVSVQHVFYGESEAECDATFRKHAAGCEFLGPAIIEDRIETEIEEIDDDEWPDYD
jgi:hypothetical protein